MNDLTIPEMIGIAILVSIVLNFLLFCGIAYCIGCPTIKRK